MSGSGRRQGCGSAGGDASIRRNAQAALSVPARDSADWKHASAVGATGAERRAISGFRRPPSAEPRLVGNEAVHRLKLVVANSLGDELDDSVGVGYPFPSPWGSSFRDVTDQHPRPGVEYPRNWHELLGWFLTTRRACAIWSGCDGAEDSHVGSAGRSMVAGGRCVMGCAAARCVGRRRRSRPARSWRARGRRW